MSSANAGYLIVRDDGASDAMTRQRFSRYDEAYDVVERYYADLCCSDDRVFYRIVAAEKPG